MWCMRTRACARVCVCFAGFGVCVWVCERIMSWLFLLLPRSLLLCAWRIDLESWHPRCMHESCCACTNVCVGVPGHGRHGQRLKPRAVSWPGECPKPPLLTGARKLIVCSGS
jgi:hypothetical protein